MNRPTRGREPMHGYGISQRLGVLSHDQFHVNPGSLFPSLYRLEQDGKLRAEWRATENNRRAKYYRLTAFGRRQLEPQRQRWNRASFGVTRVLGGAGGSRIAFRPWCAGPRVGPERNS